MLDAAPGSVEVLDWEIAFYERLRGRSDAALAGGNGNKPSLMPHLLASPSLDDCLASRDPVLERALSFPLE